MSAFTSPLPDAVGFSRAFAHRRDGGCSQTILRQPPGANAVDKTKRPPQLAASFNSTLRARVVLSELAFSTRFPVAATISFAAFAQLVLVETSLPQFAAHIPPDWSLAGLPVSPAVSFAPLP